MHLKKSEIFVVVRTQKHFQHQQGHQQTNTLPGSIIIIKNGNITVQEVEQQKTVNTKNEKRFSVVRNDSMKTSFV